MGDCGGDEDSDGSQRRVWRRRQGLGDEDIRQVDYSERGEGEGMFGVLDGRDEVGRGSQL